MPNCNTIAICNQKGGVGKTTTTVNLGVGLAMQGKKVLLVDADPQGDLTTCLGWKDTDNLPVALPDKMVEVMQDKCKEPMKGILHHKEGVDLIPSNSDLFDFEISLVTAMNREAILRNYLNEVKHNYDYIIIDCSPSLGMMTLNALSAADSVIIPVQAHYLPAKCMTQLMRTITKVKKHINPRLRIDGILLTLVDNRTNLAKSTIDALRENFGSYIKIYNTHIPIAIKAAEVSSKGKSIYISTKDRAEHSTYAAENSADEYASDKFERGVDATVHEGIHQFDKAGRKGLETTKDNIHKAKDGIDRFKEKRAEKALEKQAEKVGDTAAKTAERTTEQTVRQTGSKTVKTVEKATTKTVKQSATSAGKKTVKTVGKGTVKTTGKTVKTAERTAKTAIKTSQEAAKAAQKTAQASAKAARAAAQAARAAAKAAVVAAKWIAKATVAVVKAIIAAVKGLVAAIAAGGWVAVVIIIVICLVALILCSVFGIFFSGEDSGTGQTMQTAVQEINTEYDNKLLEIRNGTTYDVLEMSGSRAVWKDVLAVYAVKTNTDPDNPQEVATMDDNKKQLLKDLFWEMNEVSSRTESVSETVITETDDGNGNIVQTETTVTRTYLYITVAHKTVDEMASQYGFNQEQKDYLTELLKPENNSLWAAALYGINYSDDQIVTVALTQIGNVGGDPYWSWYGFGSRVEWCACFVSWCANECGYIDTGVIPKYAGCVNGVQWFKDRGQWVDGSAEPVAGMIIFFDWDSPDGESGPQDGLSDHTGIVQKVENGIVYTVEGNSGDSVRQKQYSVGYYEILGYGVPQY